MSKVVYNSLERICVFFIAVVVMGCAAPYTSVAGSEFSGQVGNDLYENAYELNEAGMNRSLREQGIAVCSILDLKDWKHMARCDIQFRDPSGSSTTKSVAYRFSKIRLEPRHDRTFDNPDQAVPPRSYFERRGVIRAGEMFNNGALAFRFGLVQKDYEGPGMGFLCLGGTYQITELVSNKSFTIRLPEEVDPGQVVTFVLPISQGVVLEGSSVGIGTEREEKRAIEGTCVLPQEIGIGPWAVHYAPPDGGTSSYGLIGDDGAFTIPLAGKALGGSVYVLPLRGEGYAWAYKRKVEAKVIGVTSRHSSLFLTVTAVCDYFGSWHGRYA